MKVVSFCFGAAVVVLLAFVSYVGLAWLGDRLFVQFVRLVNARCAVLVIDRVAVVVS